MSWKKLLYNYVSYAAIVFGLVFGAYGISTSTTTTTEKINDNGEVVTTETKEEQPNPVTSKINQVATEVTGKEVGETKSSTSTTVTPDKEKAKNTDTKPKNDTTNMIVSTGGETTTDTKTGNSTSGSNVVTTPSQSQPSNPPAEEKLDTATLSVKTPDGYLISPQTLKIDSDTTVEDVLKQATKDAGIGLDSTGSGSMFYTIGIGGLSEFDKGPNSGWIYKVNGAKGDRSAGAMNLNNGDKVEWIYVTDYTEDE